MHHRDKNGPRSMALIVILGLVAAFMAAAPTLQAEVANEVCAGCHDEVSEMFINTSHGIYFSDNAALAGVSCEKCHGSGVEHANEGDPALIINPSNSDQFGAAEMCLTCHDDHKFDDWQMSSHKGADITCADCHKVHVDASKSSMKSSPQMCYTCHTDVRAAAYMPSHHPIAEGKMKCEDCHNVHGGSTAMTLDDSGRELCLSCHGEKEGPFVYEHAPVSEECLVCHTPHGSVANSMLKQSEPTLCLSCHPMHFHSISYAVDGPFTIRDRSGVSTLDGFKVGMNTKCTQCHSEIHGSDSPSQTISTGGNTLTR